MAIFYFIFMEAIWILRVGGSVGVKRDEGTERLRDEDVHILLSFRVIARNLIHLNSI